MPERERAYLDGNLVTILEGRIGRSGKCKIRNQFGFVQEVPAKSLDKIPANDPQAKLVYGDPD